MMTAGFRKAAVGVIAAVVASICSAAAGSDMTQGRGLFERRCTGCHGLDQARAGPRLRGVFGREAGKDPRFRYSKALKKTRVTWDEATLDKWLADPESVIPETEMPFRLENAGERAAIVAFLKTVAAK